MTLSSPIKSGDSALDLLIETLNQPRNRFARLVVQARTELIELLRGSEVTGAVWRETGDGQSMAAQYSRDSAFNQPDKQRAFRDLVDRLLAEGATVNLEAEAGGI